MPALNFHVIDFSSYLYYLILRISDEWSGLDKKAGGSSGFLMALLIQVRPLSKIANVS
jgi:hypothetical protein